MSSEMVMLNVRMERELRERGSAALADMGVTPSEYVRASWRALTGDRREAEALVCGLMAPKRTPERQAEIDRKLAVLAGLDASWGALAETLALDISAYPAAVDDRDARAEERYAYLQEKWGEQA